MDIKTKRMGEPEVKDVKFKARNDDSLKKRVIILPIINLSAYKTEMSTQIAANTLMRELLSTGEVTLLKYSDITGDINKFREGDKWNLKAIAPLAWKIGAHSVIEARVKDIRTKKIGDTVGVMRKVKAEASSQIEINMVSAKSGQLLVDEEKSAKLGEEITRVAEYSYTDKQLQDNPVLIEAALEASIRETIPPIVAALRKLTWEGRIALVQGEKVFLNAGRATGLQVGDLLRIVETQKEVFDPETGEFIGDVRGRMKGTVEVIGYFGVDGAVTLVHSGSGFKENDLVEFY